MKIHIPMKLPSLANERMHWRTLDRVKRAQKSFVQLAVSRAELPPLPAVVTLTRIGKRKLDSDNLASSFKYVRDQIASTMGVDDGSDLYRWCYDQRIGKEYGIEIDIEPVEAMP